MTAGLVRSVPAAVLVDVARNLDVAAADIDRLREELADAIRQRDAARAEVADLTTHLGELRAMLERAYSGDTERPGR